MWREIEMGLHCGYCGCYHMTHEMAEGNCCIRCYNKREENPLERFNPENDKTDKLRDERTMKPCELCKLPYSTELNKRYCDECQNVKNDVEEKGMINRLETINYYGVELVKIEDYLKMVEEKENLEKYYEQEKELRKNIEDNLHRVQNHLKSKVNECNERDKEIEKLNNELIESIKISNLNVKFYEDNLKEKDKKIERLKEANKYCVDCSGSRVHINKLEKQNEYYAKEYERLKDLYEPEPQYEEWCTLSYSYEDNEFNKKYFEQEMLLEDAYELIGMDSDNWRNFSVNKYKKEVK